MGLGNRKQRAGFSSRQCVYESPRPSSTVPNLWDNWSQISGHRDYMCGYTHPFLRAFFLKIEMGGKAILGLSRLDYPSAKTGEAVNGGAESAVHLDR